MRKMLLKSCLLTGTILMMTTGSVQAAAGDLNVNDQVIERQDQGQQQQINTAYQVVPDLFLNDRNQRARQKQIRKQRTIKFAKKTIFKRSNSQISQLSQQTVGRKISFKRSAETEQLDNSTETQRYDLLNWLKYSLIGGLLILASLMGIFLGKRYAKIFRRGQKNG